MSCDIIIPVWNQLQLTKGCIEHLVKNTFYPYRLIIIDNGSQQETQQYLKQLSQDTKMQVTLIRNETNLGFVKAINQGLMISSTDYACLLNNDVFVGEGWLTEIVRVAKADSRIGIVNPDNKEMYSESIEDFLKQKSKELKSLRGYFTEVMAAMGFCMLIKREVISKIGLLDETFGLGGYDDMDYSKRSWQSGYKCVAAKGAFVIHRIHSSFAQLGERNKINIGKQTRALFWKKWGEIPRLAFVVSRSLNDKTYFSSVYDLTHNLARDWNIVNLFLRNSSGSFQPKHESIKLTLYPDKLFFLGCLVQVLKPRKNRLRFRKIFIDNSKFSKILRLSGFIHRAEVILI